MKLNFLFALICGIFHCEYVFGYKILGIFPTMMRSHHHVGRGLMKGLAFAGHNVTIVSPFKDDYKIENYNEIQLKEALTRFRKY